MRKDDLPPIHLPEYAGAAPHRVVVFKSRTRLGERWVIYLGTKFLGKAATHQVAVTAASRADHHRSTDEHATIRSMRGVVARALEG